MEKSAISKRCFLTLSFFLLLLLILPCSMAIGATHHITGFQNETICNTSKIAITYVDADGDYNTGVQVGNTWYPNETQVAVYYLQGDLSVGGDSIDFGFCGACDTPPYCQPSERVKGKFVIRFIDALATGWVWNSPSTWKEKKIKKISWQWWHGIEIVLNYPNSYMQVKAYEHWNGGNMVDSRSIGYSTSGSTETIDSATGFSELYFSTDFSISDVWDMWAYTDSPQTNAKRDEIIGVWSTGAFYLYRNSTGGWSHSYLSAKPDGASPSGDIEAGDITGDGIADIASAWTDGAKYQNGSTRAFSSTGSEPVRKISVGDITGDNKAEVVTSESTSIWYKNIATNRFTRMTTSGWATTGDIAAGDITGDGRADVASCWPGNGLWYQNGSSLGWHRITTYVPYNIAVGDLTGDGKTEVVGTFPSGIWSWNPATGGWKRLTGSGYVTDGDIATGDFNKDGRADIVSCWPSGIWVRYSHDGSWSKVTNLMAPYRITAGQLTGD